MRATFATIVVVLCSVISLGCNSSGNSSSDGMSAMMHPDQAKIDADKKLANDFIEAFNRGNADAMAALFTDDAVLYPPGEMECSGRQAIHDGFARFFRQNPGAKLTLMNSTHTPAGDNVIGTGQWTATMPNGQSIHGRYTHVIAKRNGKWVYLVDHASIPAGK
jgi:uncharacterized protein (TIGR02246 family)